MQAQCFQSAIIHLYPLNRTLTVSKNKAQLVDHICEDLVNHTQEFHHRKPVVILVQQVTFVQPACAIVISLSGNVENI